MRKLLLTGLLALIPALASGQSKTVVAGKSIANYLPADTVLLISASDVEQVIRKIEACPLYKIKTQNEFKSILALIENGWNEAKAEAKEETGVDIEAFLKSSKGEISIAIGSIKAIADKVGEALSTLEEPEITPDMIPVLFTVDAKSGKDVFAKNWKTLIEFGKKNGVPIKEESFQGGKLTTVSRPEGEDDGPENVFLGQLGSRFFVCLNKDMLQQTIAAMNSGGQSDSLADSPDFKATSQKVSSSGDFYMYVNIESVTKAVDSALSASMFAFFWQKFQQLFLGKTLKNAAVSLNLEPDGIREKAFINNGGADDGFLGWFKAPPMSPAPSPLIPPEAMTFSSMGVKAGAVFKAIREVVETVMAFQGVGSDLDGQFEQIFGFKLKALERSFGNQLHSFQIKGGGGDNPVGDLTLIFQLNDDAPWKQLLEKAAIMSQGALSSEKFLSRDLYSMETGIGFAPSIVATDKLLVIGFSKDNVKKVISRVGKTTSELAASENFKKVASYYPAKVAGMSYTDAKFFESMMKNLSDTLRMTAPGEIPDEAFTVLSTLSKSFGSMVGYSLWTNDGLYSEGWVPYRK